jgi:uncharacterized protein (DUF169 family)
MHSIKKYSNMIYEAVGLKNQLVALKFLVDLEPVKDRPVAQGHRFCQLIMRARKGEELLLTPEAISCPGAATALGFKPLPPNLESGQMLKAFGIFEDPGKGALTIRAMPRLELGKFKGIIAGPLDRVSFDPDVIIAEDEVEKLMWMALAYLNTCGGRLEFSTAILQAMCVDTAVIPYKQNRLNMSFGCYGCRDATDIQPGEAALGFPASALADLAEHLSHLAQKAIPNCRAKTIYRSLADRLNRPGGKESMKE